MKSQIRKLPESIITKIAAGQVVQNPATVVKELLENSLDAGASQIDISLDHSGTKKIEVTDNGTGMTKKDLSLSFLPHTTSKITKQSDLTSITTLGFRGEALASISSAASLQISSKTASNSVGYMYRLHKSAVSDESRIGMQTGTRVIVHDLFSKIPARKKQLKGKKTELTRIIDSVERIALSNPQVGFRLVNNNKHLIDIHPESQSARVQSVIGASLFKHMIPLSYKGDHLTIKGHLGTPQVASTTRKKMYVYINSRPVKNEEVLSVIKRAYGTLLSARMHPTCVLFLSLPDAMIDVNIHPQKTYVSIINSQSLLSSLEKQIKKTLNKHDLTYQAADTPLFKFNKALSDELLTVSKPWSTKISTKGLDTIQFDDVYILATTHTEVLLIDQHAAHEKILFNQYKSAFKHSLQQHKTITLKPATILHVSAKDLATILNAETKLQKLGFTVEDFGNNSLKIRTIPKYAKGVPLDIALRELATKSSEELHFQTLATVACKAAIKDGETLSKPEMKKLVRKLLTTEDFYTCPHGRPTIIRLTRKNLDILFKRT